MTLIIELPEELEHALNDEANELGLPITEYALRLLLSRPVAEQAPKTGAELVAYWRKSNLIGTRPDIVDSQTYARQLRRKAETRTRA